MNRAIILALGFLVFLFTACQEQTKLTEETKIEVKESDPKDMLKQAYQLFKEGDDEQSEALANKVLEIGKAENNDTLIGRALTSLCRNSQRKHDTLRLSELSAELKALAIKTGNKQWLMYQAHMNAEMWRLLGHLDRAETYYNESLSISKEIGSKGMYTIDHFNKSFVSIAKGDFETAKDLIKKYYELRREENPKQEDAYGLIALAYWLEQQKDYPGAYEVSLVTRRLFKEQNLFPEPPDEKPLLMVENKVQEALDNATMENIRKASENVSVSELLNKHL
jgi:hypothetical protein